MKQSEGMSWAAVLKAANDMKKLDDDGNPRYVIMSPTLFQQMELFVLIQELFKDE